MPVFMPLLGCSFRAVDAGLLGLPAPLFGFPHAAPTSATVATHASDEYFSHR